MFRKTFNLTQYQEDFLEQLSKDGISISEHIRTAISEYIERKKKELLDVSMSPSKLMKGGQNG